ncbi:MAG TPA: hypothetical protein PKW90_24535, partial [Myxococcota bacterium]|nr:hypothetical protein [Myxococcota bacterium]
MLEGPARPLAGFELAWAESAIWSGEDTPLLVRVLSTNNPPLHLAAAPTLAAASSTTPLDLQVTAPFEWSETDRGWKGKVRATGESLDGLVRVAAGAYSQSLPLPPVVVGRTTEVPILDADWCPRLGQLLTLQGPPIHPLGSLVTLDPDSGLETARLLLPTPATSLSLTPDGGAAWLLSTRRSVLRADATSWSVSGEVPLPPSLDPNAVPAALCALGGTPDRVVVGLLATNPTPKLKLLLLLGDQFAGSPLEIPSPLGGPVRLLSTERPDEVLVVLPDLAYVVTSQPGQLSITHTSPPYVLFPRDSM